MKVTKENLRKILEGVLREQSVSGAVEGYQTPKAFGNKVKASSPFNTKVERPKRPSHTKMFDYK